MVNNFFLFLTFFSTAVTDDSSLTVILISLLPLVLTGTVVVGMFYWYRTHRQRMHSQEWESSIKKRKKKGLDCGDSCAIMTDDDGSDISSTHANSLNHNTEPLPIELDLLVCSPAASLWCSKTDVPKLFNAAVSKTAPPFTNQPTMLLHVITYYTTK